ncbi:MAG: hypothetical protein B6D41_01445 [Chloroflexi bacterium UTCFX4]|nr:MAG: hypothetical protein B6D41_01445 [Chloroflexi bacterium UTCFX4]
MDRVVERIGIIAQARLRSTRLPRKVLAPIGAAPLLQHLTQRLKLARKATTVVIATGDEPANTPIIELCQTIDVACFVGSEQDTLDRMIQAARCYELDAIVRVTADNPLTDPYSIDEGIRIFRAQALDYFDNICYKGHPHGMGYEIISRRVLEFSRAQWQMPENLEHVTWALRRHLSLFRHAFFEVPPELHRPRYRLSVDHPEDLELLRHVYAALNFRDDATLREIVTLLDAHPEMVALNAQYADTLMTRQTLENWQLPLDDTTRQRWTEFAHTKK